MADLKNMLAQAAAVQSRLKEMQETLERLIVSAASGGGMVSATADGKGNVRTIKIDPSVVGSADVEMLEDLVLAAVTEVQRKATAAAESEMQKATGGLSLPFKLPF